MLRARMEAADKVLDLIKRHEASSEGALSFEGELASPEGHTMRAAGMYRARSTGQPCLSNLRAGMCLAPYPPAAEYQQALQNPSRAALQGSHLAVDCCRFACPAHPLQSISRCYKTRPGLPNKCHTLLLTAATCPALPTRCRVPAGAAHPV